MYKWFRLRTASRNRAFYRPLLFLFTIAVCRATLVNRTIDSKFGDPVTGFVPIYQPQDMWVDQTCPSSNSTCLYLDKAKAFDGTWNVAFYYPALSTVNVTLQFSGVAIWVFFIILPVLTKNLYMIGNGTKANITLDGQYAGTFSHNPDNIVTTDLIYNATIFHTSGLANTPHELVIGTTLEDYQSSNIVYVNSNDWLIFDWAVYTQDSEPSASQNASSSTSVAFPSTTSSSSMASMTPTSSSKIGVVVGCTLGGLAVITLVLVFLVRRLRRAPPIRNGNAEGILDIDAPPHHQSYYRREIPVLDHEPMQSKAARLREARQRELDERILSAQRELDNLRPLRNARSAGETGDPSAAGPSQPSPELASLRNEMQQLRDRMDLQAQREPYWAQGLSNELPPAYSQLSNNVR